MNSTTSQQSFQYQSIINRLRQQIQMPTQSLRNKNNITAFKIPAFSLDKYHNNANYINCINQIISQSNLETWIQFRQTDFLANDQQFMRRFYHQHQYQKKLDGLTQYYKFHRNLTKIYDKPIEKIMEYYNNKRRHQDYKQMKKLLKQEQNISMTTQKSASSYTITIQQEGKKSHYSNMLNSLQQKMSSDSKFLQNFCQHSNKDFRQQRNFKKKKQLANNQKPLKLQQKNNNKIQSINFDDIQSIVKNQNQSHFEAYLNQNFFFQIYPNDKPNNLKRGKHINKEGAIQKSQASHNISKFRRSIRNGRAANQSIQRQKNYNNKYSSQKQLVHSSKLMGNFKRKSSKTKKFSKDKSKQNKSNNQTISREDIKDPQKNQYSKGSLNNQRLSRGFSKKRLLHLKQRQTNNQNLNGFQGGQRNSVNRLSTDNIKRKNNIKIKNNVQRIYGVDSNENSKENCIIEKQKDRAINNKKTSTMIFKKERKLSSGNLKKNLTINHQKEKIAQKILELDQQYKRRRSKSMKRILKPAASNLNFQAKQKVFPLNQNRGMKRCQGSTSNLLKRASNSRTLFRSHSTNNHIQPKTHRQLHRKDNFTKQNDLNNHILRYSSSNFQNIKQYKRLNNGSKKMEFKEIIQSNLKSKQMHIQALLNKKLQNIIHPSNRIF